MTRRKVTKWVDLSGLMQGDVTLLSTDRRVDPLPPSTTPHHATLLASQLLALISLTTGLQWVIQLSITTGNETARIGKSSSGLIQHVYSMGMCFDPPPAPPPPNWTEGQDSMVKSDLTVINESEEKNLTIWFNLFWATAWWCVVKLGKDSNLAIWFGLLGPQRGDMDSETQKGQEFGHPVWSLWPIAQWWMVKLRRQESGNLAVTDLQFVSIGNHHSLRAKRCDSVEIFKEGWGCKWGTHHLMYVDKTNNHSVDCLWFDRRLMLINGSCDLLTRLWNPQNRMVPSCCECK